MVHVRCLCPSLLLLATIATPEGLNAQAPTMTMQLPHPATVTAQDAAGRTDVAVQPRGDVTNGFWVDALTTTAHSHCTAGSMLDPHDQRLHVSFSGSCGAVGGSTARLDDPALLVQFSLPRPMALRFWTSIGVIASTNSPSATSRIDLGNDGNDDFVFTSQPGVCEGRSRQTVLNLPAGAYAVRMTLALDMQAPPQLGGRSATVYSQLRVEAGHTSITEDSSACGALLWATPMFDRNEVRLHCGQASTDMALLILGTGTAAVPLPVPSGCELLVQPDLVLAVTSPYVFLPVAGLGPTRFFAQSVVLRPGSLNPQIPSVVTSQRLALTVH